MQGSGISQGLEGLPPQHGLVRQQKKRALADCARAVPQRTTNKIFFMVGQGLKKTGDWFNGGEMLKPSLTLGEDGDGKNQELVSLGIRSVFVLFPDDLLQRSDLATKTPLREHPRSAGVSPCERKGIPALGCLVLLLSLISWADAVDYDYASSRSDRGANPACCFGLALGRHRRQDIW